MAKSTSATRRSNRATQEKGAVAPSAAQTSRAISLTKSAKGSGVDRRGEILAIAARRFAEFGFSSATMREIAKDADILPGSIYHHFGTKEEILHEIIREPITSLRNGFFYVLHMQTDPERKFSTLIHLVMRRLLEDPLASTILYNDRKHLLRNPQFKYVKDYKREMYEIWRKVVEQGVEEKQFRENMDEFLAVTTLIRMLNSCADWYRYSDEFPVGREPKRSVEQIEKFNLELMLAFLRRPERLGEPLPDPVQI